ncbi:MAG: type VI secretion system contractile sheath large subunit [Azoarcus sp.]|nr:type VI secretion system contractile sheath large subunit [Azoarcus sp.]
MTAQETALEASPVPEAAAAEATSLLDTIIEQSKAATNELEKERARDLIGELAQQVLAGEVTVSKDLSASIDARVAQLDAVISAQLNEIMHQPAFQELEASWRGLNYLVMESETSTQLKIKVLNISKKDLLKDFKRASEFDQSALFKKNYMKAIMRDKIGSFASRQDVQSFLNKWVQQYVLLDDAAGQEAKAKCPLREARVDVTEIPGKPGAYRAVTFLRPHFQLDELTISLRLVAELPQPAK